MEKTIYTIGLHESVTFNNGMSVLRVPGGWLYDYWDSERDLPKTSVFVPFSNEFQNPKDLNLPDYMTTQMPDFLK